MFYFWCVAGCQWIFIYGSGLVGPLEGTIVIYASLAGFRISLFLPDWFSQWVNWALTEIMWGTGLWQECDVTLNFSKLIQCSIFWNRISYVCSRIFNKIQQTTNERIVFGEQFSLVLASWGECIYFLGSSDLWFDD